MATLQTTQPHSSTLAEKTSHVTSRTLLWSVPIGRLFFSLIFIMAGFSHFSEDTIRYAANSGVAMPEFIVPASGVLAIAGGLLIAAGFYARLGALFLIAFLVPVTLVMHNFWALQDPAMSQMQMIHFMKNLSMLGGAFLILVYGAGPFSMDNHVPKK
jgi:putative oxidoreductase